MTILWFGLGLLLALTIITDLRERTIPNWLTGLVALLAIASWFAKGLALWPDIALQVAQALGALLLFAIFFVRGAMGGGDVKLIAALALWLPLQMFVNFLMVMSLLGGALSIFYLLKSRGRDKDTPVEVPYGVAIALAGFWVIANQFVTFLPLL